MSGPLRIGIRGRLFSAFGVVAATTIAATVIAWVSFTRLGDTLDLIVGRNVPAVTLAAQLAERGVASSVRHRRCHRLRTMWNVNGFGHNFQCV